MQTDLVHGAYVEIGDWLPATDERLEAQVHGREDEGDFIFLDLVDAEGEHHEEKVAPFDSVQIVVSFEDGPDCD